MNANRIEFLLTGHLNKSNSLDEQTELEALVNSNLNDPDFLTGIAAVWRKHQPGEFMSQELSDHILSRILQHIEDPASTVESKKRTGVLWLAWAAAILIIMGIGIYFKNSGSPSATAELAEGKSKSVPFNRYISLPDGSTVILQAGSSLTYNGNFKGNTREVSLLGEAYFDITKDTSRPFIIHTGEVQTIVLGTAFNIKAWPEQKNITISVTRGKVKVARKAQLLAILTANQQVVYHPGQDKEELKNVDANELVTDWTKKDMVFNVISFEKIAEMLMNRYDVKIQFANPKMRKCDLRANFSGTESLEHVLSVLCKVLGADYHKINDKQIVIEGNDCG